jgi:hypothetical protein
MSARPLPRIALVALAALSSAAFADDDPNALVQRARAAQSVPQAPPPAAATHTAAECSAANPEPSPGVFCNSVETCRSFCACACVFDATKWKPDVKNDGSTTCPGMPTNEAGMISPDSPDLTVLPSYTYITHDRGEKAGPAALAGLAALETRLESSENRRRYNYTVRVVSCYRPQSDDSVPECGFVLKGAYMLARVKAPDQTKYWQEKSDPRNLGLTWPGRTPHSGGIACDLVLLDSRGNPSFDSRAGVDGAPTSAIPARDASRMLDEEVTAAEVGGSRLTFEAWHYEWGVDGQGGRCKAPDCANNYWPVTGRPGNR